MDRRCGYVGYGDAFVIFVSFLLLRILGALYILLSTDGLTINDGGMYSTKVR